MPIIDGVVEARLPGEVRRWHELDSAAVEHHRAIDRIADVATVSVLQSGSLSLARSVATGSRAACPLCQRRCHHLQPARMIDRYDCDGDALAERGGVAGGASGDGVAWSVTTAVTMRSELPFSLAAGSC